MKLPNWLFFWRRKSPEEIQLEEFLCHESITAEDVRRAWHEMSTTHYGRTCISHLLNSCGVTNFARIRNDEDRLRQEGRRQFGFSVLEMLALDEHQIQKIIMNRVEAKANAASTRPTQYKHE